jgi:hypothetical protein
LASTTPPSGRTTQIAAGSASIVLNLIALRLLVETWDPDPFWTQMALIPFFVIFNFLTSKFWSLRHREPPQ